MRRQVPRLVWSVGFFGSLIAWLCVAPQANSYLDAPGFVTPPRFMEQFESVAVVTVEKLNADKSAVICRVTEQLWGRGGKLSKGSVLKHHSLPKALFAKLKPGQVGVLLHDIETSRLSAEQFKVGDTHHLVFMEGTWYQAGRNPDDPQWWGCWTTRNYDSMFLGSTEELASVFRKLAQGEDVVVRRQTVAEERKEGAQETALVQYSMKAPHHYRQQPAASVKAPTIDATLPATVTKPLEHLELRIACRRGESEGEGRLREALQAVARVRYVICKATGLTRIYFRDESPNVEELIRAATKAGFQASRPTLAK